MLRSRSCRSRQQYAVATQVGSSLVRNAAIRRPPNNAQRHHFDHALNRCELRSVESTAAPNDNSLMRADDATAVTKRMSQSASPATDCVHRRAIPVIVFPVTVGCYLFMYQEG